MMQAECVLSCRVCKNMFVLSIQIEREGRGKQPSVIKMNVSCCTYDHRERKSEVNERVHVLWCVVLAASFALSFCSLPLAPSPPVTQYPTH